MSTTAQSRDKVELLYLQKVLERVSKLPQATIAKIEGMVRGKVLGGQVRYRLLDYQVVDMSSVCAATCGSRIALVEVAPAEWLVKSDWAGRWKSFYLQGTLMPRQLRNMGPSTER
eukprot:GHVN01056021.1.p1 GENE.GHVN01056021.1~~GHVN01056021.1.p1  ORF type:complete len:115 (+),score=14.59 GHVN01056021.1:240-584(+)